MKKYKVVKELNGEKTDVFNGTVKECFMYMEERSVYNEDNEKWETRDGGSMYVVSDKE